MFEKQENSAVQNIIITWSHLSRTIVLLTSSYIDTIELENFFLHIITLECF